MYLSEEEWLEVLADPRLMTIATTRVAQAQGYTYETAHREVMKEYARIVLAREGTPAGGGTGQPAPGAYPPPAGPQPGGYLPPPMYQPQSPMYQPPSMYQPQPPPGGYFPPAHYPLPPNYMPQAPGPGGYPRVPRGHPGY